MVATTGNTLKASDYLSNVSRYEDVAAATAAPTDEMGQSQFLTLFTAQLKNQNPLDPVKNEAFVAQLAQFSQLEALTGMKSSLDGFVSSMSGERLLSSAALIGKTVAMENTAVNFAGQASMEGMIALPEGASGIGVQVVDAQGQVIRNLAFGPQLPGEFQFSWDGKADDGNAVAEGAYRFRATGVVNEGTRDIAVRTAATIRAIVRNPLDDSIQVEVDDGTTLALSDVLRIAQ